MVQTEQFLFGYVIEIVWLPDGWGQSPVRPKFEPAFVWISALFGFRSFRFQTLAKVRSVVSQFL